MRDVVGDTFVCDTFDDLMTDLLDELLERPDFVCSPRDSEIREILLPRLVLTDPRNRLITLEARKANYGFAVGEFLWYWRGSNRLDEMTYYNKRMPSFSDDGETLNSAYGMIMKGLDDPYGSFMGWDEVFLVNQWGTAIRTLLNDPDSRRAILQIHHPVHQLHADMKGSNDVPCTLSLQFFIRDDRLHMHVHMRSNDVVWGLTNDLFSFTLFQECMLLELKGMGDKFKDLRLGRYIHTAGSMHVYKRHYAMAKKMVNEMGERLSRRHRYSPTPVTDPMPDLESLDGLESLVNRERELRTKEIELIDTSEFSGATKWMAERLNEHRRKRDEED